MHMYHTIREKLCHKLLHPGCALDLKTKDLIGSEETLLFISQSLSRISMCNLHWYYTFCSGVLRFLHCVTLELHRSQPFRIE